jgi:hypothetical protein
MAGFQENLNKTHLPLGEITDFFSGKLLLK